MNAHVPVILATPARAPRRSYARQFVLNTLYGTAGRFLQLGISLFLVGYVVRKLGREQWGLVVLATTVVNFLSLIELGTSAGLAKKLNTFMTRGDTRRFRQYFTAGIVLCTILSAAMVLLLVVVLTIVWPFMNVAADLSREGRFVLVAVAASTVCTLLSLPYGACLQAVHRIDIDVRRKTSAAVLRCVLAVALFELTEPRASIYGLVLAVTSGVMVLQQCLWVRRHVPDARAAWGSLNRALFRDVLAFNVLTLFNSLNYMIFMQAPAFVLQAKASLQITGLYGIALQLNNVVLGVLIAPTNALSPVTVSLESAGRLSDLRRVFCVSTKAYTAVGIMMWVWFFMVGDEFLRLWLARDVSELARALPWFIGASAVGTMTLPASVVIVAVERLRVPAVSGIVLACVMIATMVMISGSAEAHILTTASMLLACFFNAYQLLRFWIVARVLNVTAWESVTSFVARPALPALIAGLVLWVGVRYGYTHTVATSCHRGPRARAAAAPAPTDARA